MVRSPAHNSTYKKLAVQWLNEALCFVSSSVVADSLVLRNRQLLVAAKRYRSFYGDSANIIRQCKNGQQNNFGQAVFAILRKSKREATPPTKPTQVASHLLLPQR